MRTVKCRCCEREFTYIEVDGERERSYCSICYGPARLNCVKAIHCDIHCAPKKDIECVCNLVVG